MYPSETLLFSSPLLWILFAATALVCFLEYKLRAKWLWILCGALLQTAAVILLLFADAALADLLLYVLGVILIRLCFECIERRRAA